MEFNRKKSNKQSEKCKRCYYCKFQGFALFEVVDLILECCSRGYILPNFRSVSL
jgi:hypothetical protein